jgi:hypothetical protein
MEGLTIGAIIVGLIVTLIVFFLGYAVNFIWEAILNWKLKKVWKQFRTEKVAKVIISTRPGLLDSSTPRVSLAEVRAFQSIEHISIKLGIQFELVESTVELNTLSQDNLIILGGPKANKISEHYWEEIKSKVPYKICLETQTIQLGDKTYTPQKDGNGKYKTDYSLVVKISKPKSDKHVYFFAGCHGFGTSGSTRIVSEKAHVAKLAKRVGNKDFVAIVETNIVNGSVDTVQISEAFCFA